MADFLEERLPIDVRIGASYGDEYGVEITATRSGAEYRALVNPFPVRHFVVEYTKDTAAFWDTVLALYHRAYGMYAGFRVNCKDDNSTNGRTSAPTATDQPLALVSTGVYQLQKEYGAGATPLAIGRPKRILFKPVAGSALVSISDVTIRTADWTLDSTTGRITFSANVSKAITGITQAASAVVTVGSHAYSVGQSVHFSGVVGMTQINGRRGTITAFSGTTITVDINSTTFTAYASGGTVNTRPQSGESVKGGCYFDIPARFNSRIDVRHIGASHRESGSIDLIELLNP